MQSIAAAWPRPRPRFPRLAPLAWPLLAFVLVLGLVGIHYQGQTLPRGPDQADMLLAFFNEASHAIDEEGPLAAMYTQGVRAGESNWSNPNYHVLYPFYFNWVGADASPDATLDRLNLIVRLHLALFGAGMFVLARALGVRTALALALAVAVPWFPAVRSAAAWPHIIAGMAWLPWLLAAQARLYAGRDWRAQLPAAAALAFASIMLVLAHPAQNLVFAACASGLGWLLMAAQVALARDRAGMRDLLRSSAWIALAAAALLAATLPYLLEIIAFHARSIRWLGEVGGHVLGNEPLTLESLRFHAVDMARTHLLLAFERQPAIGNVYLGAAVLVGALAVLDRQLAPGAPTRFARALLGCGLVATAFCFEPMAPLLAQLPLAGRVRELAWWSCLAVVALLPAAALGLQGLCDRVRPALARDPWAWLAGAALLAGLLAALISDTGYRATTLASLLVAFGALAWCIRGPRSQRAAAAAALVLLATAWTPAWHNVRFAYEDATLFDPDRVQARADAAALASRLEGLDQYRMALGHTLPNHQLIVHSWTLHGFRTIQGGIGPTEYDKFRLLVQGGPALRALYGVRWSLWPEADALPGDAPLREGLVLRTHPDALPRLFALHGGLQASDDPVAELLAVGAGSPLRAVVDPADLPAGVERAMFEGEATRAECIDLRRNDRTALDATVNCPRPVLVLLNEDPAARWQATLDGTPVPVFRVNGYQVAIAIDAPGPHALRIERPAHLFRRGGAGTADTAAHLAH